MITGTLHFFPASTTGTDTNPPFEKICCNFPETLDCLPEGKAVLTGSPIRQELLSGNKIAAMDLCKFTADKPVILVIGGSLGSVVVNNAVRESLPCLLKDFQIIHLCGKGKTDESLKNTKEREIGRAHV